MTWKSSSDTASRWKLYVRTWLEQLVDGQLVMMYFEDFTVVALNSSANNEATGNSI
jgi:hypothetical protein